MITDVRGLIRDMVADMIPFDQMEQDHINFVLPWIDSGCEIFRIKKPATPDIHLVSYFVLVSRDTNQVLLTDHKISGLWLPPGGHLEPGEHPREAAIREAREELGIDAEFLFDEPIFLTATKTVGNITQHTDVSLWYILKGNPDCHFEYDLEEFNQIRWFDFDEIPFEKSDPHMKRFIQKVANRIECKGHSFI